MKKAMFIAFLAVTLAACAPATQPMNQQGTAIAVVLTDHFLTQTALPTATPPPPTVTPTATAVVFLSTPPPTQPPVPILTPDAIQVERWQKYQTELAKALFVYDPSFPNRKYGPEISKDAICEWDILGQIDEDVYMWATCLSADGLSLRKNPAVVHLRADGAIQKTTIVMVELERGLSGFSYQTYDLHLFPLDIQKTLCLYYFIDVPQCFKIAPASRYPNYLDPGSRQNILTSHLKDREHGLAELPLTILSAMPIATPSP